MHLPFQNIRDTVLFLAASQNHRKWPHSDQLNMQCNVPVKRKLPQPQSTVAAVWDNLTFMEGRGNILYPLIQHYISSPTAYIQCVDFSPSDRQAIKANSLSQCRPPGSIGNDSPGTAVAKNGKSNVIRGQNCNLVTWSSPRVFVSLYGIWEPDLLGQEAYEQSANRNTKLVLLSYNHRKLQTSNHFSPCRTTKDCIEQFGKFVS